MSVKYANKITSSIKDLRALISANSKIKERIVSEVISQFHPIHILIRSDDGLSIKINLPEAETIRTTIRINESTWNRFKKFAEEHKEFNQQDLMAQALEEYMDKYK